MKTCKIMQAAQPARRLSGAVAAELAMVSPFLTLVFLGMVELATVARDYHRVSCAAQAGAAVAGRGGTVEEIAAQARAAGGLKLADGDVMTSYRIYRAHSQSWTAWNALRNAGSKAGTSRPARCQVRVMVSCPHALVVPSFFSVFATEPDGQTVMLRSEAVAVRQ